MAKINRTTTAYIIRCLSPLHAGAGDANYGVIDNLVQRDSLTNYPIIHSSSLKGALREYFEYALSQTYEAPEATQKVSLIFGAGSQDGKEGQPPAQFKAGLYDFDLGFLLSLPVRSNKAAYVSATTPAMLEGMIERLELFELGEEAAALKLTLQPLLDAAANMKDKPLVFHSALEGAVLEDEDFKAEYQNIQGLDAIEALLGKNPALLPDAMFDELVTSLPVIARNRLENGQSKNLWYEEVVPRESRFYTTISRATWKDGDHAMQDLGSLFDETLRDKRIQVGGNATVGYGKTVFLPIENQPKPANT